MTPIVVHHPPEHPYVRQIDPAAPRGVGSVWDLDEVSSSGASIVHLHFGFEHLAVGALVEWLRNLRRRRLGLILTVHDLHNPHLADQTQYQRLLRLLVAEADAVVTLTAWAADVIEGVYGRAAQVIAHPHVVPLGELARRRHRPSRARRGVYVHAATCRPNLDADLVVAVAAVASDIGGVRVHVRSPLTPSAERLVAQLNGVELVHLDVGPRLTDEGLWDRIERAQAVLLPYRWGTHSGLLETANDLGTPCVAPAVGALVDQGAIEIDPTDTAPGLRRALEVGSTRDVNERASQRVAIVKAHQRLYATVLDRWAGAA